MLYNDMFLIIHNLNSAPIQHTTKLDTNTTYNIQVQT